MPKQTEFDLVADGLAALWTRLPEPPRREAVAMWARLIACASRVTPTSTAAQERAAREDVKADALASSTRTDREITTTNANEGATT